MVLRRSFFKSLSGKAVSLRTERFEQFVAGRQESDIVTYAEGDSADLIKGERYSKNLLGECP